MRGAKVSTKATCFLGTSGSTDAWTCSQCNGHQVSKYALGLGWRLSDSSVHKNPPMLGVGNG